MTDNLSLMEQAALEPVARGPADLAQVQAKAKRLIAIERELADCALTESRLKKEREQVRIRDLPEMMFELRMTSIGIDNVVVEVEPLVQASLPKEEADLNQAVNWLVDAKEGGVVKRQLQIELPKGDAVIEAKVIAAIRKVSPKLKPSIKPTIHHSTYSALARRLVASGKEVPLKMLGIFVGHIARVKEPE